MNRQELFNLREAFIQEGFNLCIHFNIHTKFIDIDIFEGTKKIFRISAKENEYEDLLRELRRLFEYLVRGKNK